MEEWDSVYVGPNRFTYNKSMAISQEYLIVRYDYY